MAVQFFYGKIKQRLVVIGEYLTKESHKNDIQVNLETIVRNSRVVELELHVFR
ncbi:hypothetical protein KHA93_00410 [Bacillus sp. FJAT-49732]|uniref:Uncharacterized protein n=1 Tax=Lederbergia citrisecunda TaxID=2833583 RepID=A0A942THH9_9BACI|nr:hypothetical protein [Lederbergia citrisecunda]MBS4198120.1 hypothetical protein [Lederbergia citrisecunda]